MTKDASTAIFSPADWVFGFLPISIFLLKTVPDIIYKQKSTFLSCKNWIFINKRQFTRSPKLHQQFSLKFLWSFHYSCRGKTGKCCWHEVTSELWLALALATFPLLASINRATFSWVLVVVLWWFNFALTCGYELRGLCFLLTSTLMISGCECVHLWGDCLVRIWKYFGISLGWESWKLANSGP